MMKNETKIGDAFRTSPAHESVLERIAFILTRLIGIPYIVERVFGDS